MTPTAFGSQLGATYSITMAMHLFAQQTWIQKNNTGTVWSALKMRRTCALTLKKFYLTVALEYFEYMKILLALFPAWMIEQYNLNTMALDLDGWVYIKMRRAVWGLPKAGILANKHLRRKLAPFGYYESVNTPCLWRHES